MSAYKRNQVEEAISAVLEPRALEPSMELRTRLKRLLDTDRAAGRAPRASDPERTNYAFYSAESPGSGVEIWFSDYEAFALLTGISLLRHGWPQSFVVSLMRRVRQPLEEEHHRILKLDPKRLFDQEAIRRNAQPGDMAFDVTEPVLLTIVSKPGSVRTEETAPHAFAICQGPDDAMRFFTKTGSGGTVTMFELVGVAHQLVGALRRTEPQRRGRV